MTIGSVSFVQTAAVGAGVLICGVAALQAALALGLPLGDATLGGRASTDRGVLTMGFRALAALQAVALVLIAGVILGRAGLITVNLVGARFLLWATWIIFAFLILNTIANFTAPHPVERWVMGSVTLVVAVLTGIVAFRAP